MARVQLALNVGDLDAAIEHYTKMFGVGPAKIRDGYANFAIENPPLKLVLIAVQDKVWINSGEVPWEWYTVLEDAPNDTSLATSAVNLGKKPLLMVESNGNACGPDTCC